jgi:N-acetyl-anhydromuramyl-L-alanine amidase AmpD
MNEYKTTDFCLTAYLLCEGFEIERYYSNPSKPEQLIFVFKENWTPSLYSQKLDFKATRRRNY